MDNMKCVLQKLEQIDLDTYQHSVRVEKILRNIGSTILENIGKPVNTEFIESLIIGGLLHDIGKIRISKEILTKGSQLTEHEFDIIKKHTIYGIELIEKVVLPEYVNKQTVYNIIQHHHEYWNGTGYPSGISYDSIPLEARIVAIVDVYDALRNNRSYHQGMSHNEVINLMKLESGTHFDPRIIEIVIKNDLLGKEQ